MIIIVDPSEEHNGEKVSILRKIRGVTSESSPSYAPQSNGKAGRIMQELPLEARVMFSNTRLP